MRQYLKYFIHIIILILITNKISAQDFLNNDLNGNYINGFSLPTNWQNVPFSDVNCQATDPGRDSPDLTGLWGPSPTNGLLGNAYSGDTFVSGLFGGNNNPFFWHEGIMQSVSGFTIGCSYSVNFFQTVVKQQSGDFLDSSGSWAVYFDNNLVGVSVTSYSSLPYNSTSLNWEYRSLNFTATATSHIIKFLPADNDTNQLISDPYAGLRMGIDSICIKRFIPTALLGSDTTLCQGDTLTLDATFSNSTYLWQDNSTNYDFNVTQPGTYWVTVTNNCDTITDTINVFYASPPIINLGEDTMLCQGEILTLIATSPNASYLWQDNSTDSTLVISGAGTYWTEVTVSSCIVTDTINVSYPLLILDLGIDTTLCQGETLALIATSANASYLWQDNSTDSTLVISGAGSYWTEVTVGNCNLRDTINIGYNLPPSVDFGSDTILCQGETLTLIATSANASYLWQDNSTDSTLVISGVGTYWIEVTVDGCDISRDTINVYYNQLPIIDLGPDTALCQGEMLTLIATSANASYLWQDNSTDSTLVISGVGTYWIEVTVDGCDISRDTINVYYNQLPIIDLGPDTALCQGEMLTLIATSANASYLWQDNSTDSTLVVSGAGTYWIEVTVGNCIVTDTINVNYISIPTVNLGNDTLLCVDETIILNATYINATYLWQDNSINPIFSINQKGTCWVVVTNQCGIASDTIDVTEDDCVIILIIPNTFTPNNDGINDLFVPIKNDGIEAVNTKIYNRWGQLLFISDFIEIGWDGRTTAGTNCAEGTYYWIINYTDKNDENKTLKGFVTLLR